MDEELVLFRANEFVSYGVVSKGGDDAMNMRVMLHLATPSVKDGSYSNSKVRTFEFTSGDFT